MKHTFYSDPGHGWLAVPRAELVELGIIDKITHYSYQRGNMVYLEEDCDLTTYAEEIVARGGEFDFISAKQTNSNSRIRSYECFELKGYEMYQAKKARIEAQAPEQLSLAEFFGLITDK